MHNILFGQINVLSTAECGVNGRRRKTVEKLAFALACGQIVFDFINRVSLSIRPIGWTPIAGNTHCEKRRPDPERLNIRSPAVRAIKA